ncbi:MAG TPA: Mur ligase domain-containing protein, partial [Castellaniella sp.]|nr:Mur ligase domain-containing protein [Castellaniella sp.]
MDILSWLDERVDRTADLCLDSRQVRPGDVFFACPGISTDGRQYIDQAIAAGAAAVLVQAGAAGASQGSVPLLVVDGLNALLGEIAHHWYGRPSDALTVIA